ncbi:hypothetical protein PoB_001578700 [Plakobranchus ocellatus]|uniref:Uncharacterized protein n=1 Tax=Plakobranchus ocellatus TaxID=259542 RepID=A0AAV3Z256_9GAST|nr:hypothetical protein PoB_001578700 [Plakobranchus ocellatus]
MCLREDKEFTLSPHFSRMGSRYSDSVSVLQAIQSKNFKVKDIRRLCNLIRKFPPYVKISIPAHVGIRGE